MGDVTKICSHCNITKAAEEFSRASHGGLRSQCKPCRTKCQTEHYRAKRRQLGLVVYADWAERFLDCVRVTPEGCWSWAGPVDDKGYGTLGVAGERWHAHRLSYALHFGDLPHGCYVCHHCDNPPCVNPEHLYAGNALSNARDKVARGRHVPLPGEANPAAVLTSADVAAIRAEYATGKIHQRPLAAKYGISQAQVSNIVRRVHWSA